MSTCLHPRVSIHWSTSHMVGSQTRDLQLFSSAPPPYSWWGISIPHCVARKSSMASCSCVTCSHDEGNHDRRASSPWTNGPDFYTFCCCVPWRIQRMIVHKHRIFAVFWGRLCCLWVVEFSSGILWGRRIQVHSRWCGLSGCISCWCQPELPWECPYAGRLILWDSCTTVWTHFCSISDRDLLLSWLPMCCTCSILCHIQAYVPQSRSEGRSIVHRNGACPLCAPPPHSQPQRPPVVLTPLYSYCLKIQLFKSLLLLLTKFGSFKLISFWSPLGTNC